MNRRRTARRRAGLASAALLLCCCGLALAGCGTDPGSGPTAEAEEIGEPRQFILAYDRSTSITAQELCNYQQLTGEVLGYLRHGDRIAAIEILQLSLEEVPRRWSQPVQVRQREDRESPRDEVNRRRFVQDASDYLTAFTDPDDREDYLGTDILSTLHDIAAEVRAYPDHRTTVVLFSDMLQATPEVNMEGLVRMPPAGWVEQRAAAGRLPEFGEACIVVAGARTDTAEGQRVKAFWHEYFEATGATLLDHNYAYRPVRIPEEPCS